MYLDLLTNAALLDHSVWASPDTWSATAELAAKKKRKGGNGGLIFGGICCLLVVVAIIVGIYLLTQRKNKQ
jgi:ABC-type multidrug transport system permease subunit